MIEKVGIIPPFLVMASAFMVVLLMLRGILIHCKTAREKVNEQLTDMQYKEFIKVLMTGYLGSTMAAFDEIMKVIHFTFSTILVFVNFGF